MYFCRMPVPAPGGGGGGWRHVPPTHKEGVSALKKIYIHGNGLEEFGVFGVALGVSMDRTTVMLTDQILK